jgi:hypothetical protein
MNLLCTIKLMKYLAPRVKVLNFTKQCDVQVGKNKLQFKKI